MKKFIDFDKEKLTFNVNFYFDDEKLVIKTPLHLEKNQEKEASTKFDDLSIEKFELSNKVFLSSF